MSGYQAINADLHKIEKMVPRERARCAAELLEQLDSLSRRAIAIRDTAIMQLVEEDEMSYSKAAAKGQVSKSQAAKARRRGRTGPAVKKLAELIPKRPIEQSLWKDQVCLWYAHGEPVTVAMERATATVLIDYPDFVPKYDPYLLDIAE